MTHQSTLELKNYLMNSSDEIIYNIAQILGDRLGFNSMRKRVSSVSDVPKKQAEKEALVDDMLKEIGYFGSNNFAYWGRWNKGVGYHEIVYDVVKLLNKQLKKKLDIPRLATVSEREKMICDQLLCIAFQGKSEQDIARMLNEAGLEIDASKEAAKKIVLQTGAGGFVIALVKILGKKIVTTILSTIVLKIIATKVGQEAAEKIVLRILKQVPQKTISAFVIGLGTLLIAKDILDLSSAATRVTIPVVALISTTRMLEELDK